MKREYRRWTEAEKEAILQMYIDGYSKEDIAKKFNTTKSKIKGIFDRYKIKTPKRYKKKIYRR